MKPGFTPRFVLALLVASLPACAVNPFSEQQDIGASALVYGCVFGSTPIDTINRITIEQYDTHGKRLDLQSVTVNRDGLYHLVVRAPGRYRIVLPEQTGGNAPQPVAAILLEVVPGELRFAGTMIMNSGFAARVDVPPGDELDILAALQTYVRSLAWRNRISYELEQHER